MLSSPSPRASEGVIPTHIYSASSSGSERGSSGSPSLWKGCSMCHTSLPCTSGSKSSPYGVQRRPLKRRRSVQRMQNRLRARIALGETTCVSRCFSYCSCRSHILDQESKWTSALFSILSSNEHLPSFPSLAYAGIVQGIRGYLPLTILVDFSSFYLDPVYRLVSKYNPYLVMVLLVSSRASAFFSHTTHHLYRCSRCSRPISCLGWRPLVFVCGSTFCPSIFSLSPSLLLMVSLFPYHGIPADVVCLPDCISHGPDILPQGRPHRAVERRLPVVLQFLYKLTSGPSGHCCVYCWRVPASLSTEAPRG